MAGDWIAMRHDLWNCSQVIKMVSAICPKNVRDLRTDVQTKERIIGALYRTWCLIDRFAEDGILHGYTAEVLDNELQWPGWSENLQHVGWLVIEPQHLVVPEFEEWFDESAKRRAKDAKRKRKARKSASEKCPRPSDKKRTTGQDRTEHKETPLPPSLQESPDFVSAWDDWQQYRQQLKKPLTRVGVSRTLAQLEKIGPAAAVEMINHTIVKGWQGLRAPEGASNGKPRRPKTASPEHRRKIVRHRKATDIWIQHTGDPDAGEQAILAAGLSMDDLLSPNQD